ncbi:MAG TPA: signal peptidase II [Steroidobacteraceae bacterium]|nr:signal peptidase II [Steroidobacteraceae bacterium]
MNPTNTWWESGWRWLWITALMIVLDQFTKLWIVEHVTYDIFVLPVLNIIHTVNYGAAWSMFENWGGAQRWLLSALAVAVSIAIFMWLRRLEFARHRMLIGGLTLILGGALGNVIDRLRLGHVIDFVQVHWGNSYFPAFNVADSAISVGAVLVILDSFLDHRREKLAAATANGRGAER